MKRRTFTPKKSRIRNLVQYRDMSDDEFDAWFEEQYKDYYNEPDVDEIEQILDDELEERIDEYIKKLGEDYDLKDMKVNDMLQLRALAMAMIQLDDLEKDIYTRRQDITGSNVLVLEKLNRMVSSLRSDISSISEDLQLSKKIRSKSRDVSVAARYAELTRNASEFYKKKMLFIACTDCKLLLASIWLMYPDNTKTALKLECERCGNKQTVMLHELYETKNKNIEDILV